VAKLECEMRINLVANAVRPFAEIRIAQVAEMVRSDASAVTAALVVAVNDGRVKGYVERVEGRFRGTTGAVADRKMVAWLERAEVTRERLEILEWERGFEGGERQGP
jgi:hypothetical protein